MSQTQPRARRARHRLRDQCAAQRSRVFGLRLWRLDGAVVDVGVEGKAAHGWARPRIRCAPLALRCERVCTLGAAQFKLPGAGGPPEPQQRRMLRILPLVVLGSPHVLPGPAAQGSQRRVIRPSCLCYTGILSDKLARKSVATSEVPCNQVLERCTGSTRSLWARSKPSAAVLIHPCLPDWEVVTYYCTSNDT